MNLISRAPRIDILLRRSLLSANGFSKCNINFILYQKFNYQMEANKELEEKIATDSTPDILPLEDEESENVSKEQQFLCGICKEKYKQPKVLHCLHSFCTECLEKSLLESGPTQISCQTCRQVTRLTSAGAVNELPIDAVICNLMEMDAICAMTVICTSCKTQENAVARCSDCSNFLCPNCVTAHNYMRCFEKHKVIIYLNFIHFTQIVNKF